MSTYSFIVEILPKLEHDWEVALDDNNSSSDQWEITNLEFRDRIMDTMRVFHDLYENSTIVNLSEKMQELKHYWGNWGSPELSLEKLSEAKRWGLKTLYILRELNAVLATKIKQKRYAENSNYVNKEAQTFKQVEHTISDIIASNGSTIETYTAAISHSK